MPPPAKKAASRRALAELWERVSLFRVEDSADPVILDGGVIPEGHIWNHTHRTHVPYVTGPYLWCKQCGCHTSSTSRKLMKRCESLTTHGRRAKAAFAAGALPSCYAEWPSGHSRTTRFSAYRVTFYESDSLSD